MFVAVTLMRVNYVMTQVLSYTCSMNKTSMDMLVIDTGSTKRVSFCHSDTVKKAASIKSP